MSCRGTRSSLGGDKKPSDPPLSLSGPLRAPGKAQSLQDTRSFTSVSHRHGATPPGSSKMGTEVCLGTEETTAQHTQRAHPTPWTRKALRSLKVTVHATRVCLPAVATLCGPRSPTPWPPRIVGWLSRSGAEQDSQGQGDLGTSFQTGACLGGRMVRSACVTNVHSRL